jgi:hypothetical protein
MPTTEAGDSRGQLAAILLDFLAESERRANATPIFLGPVDEHADYGFERLVLNVGWPEKYLSQLALLPIIRDGRLFIAIARFDSTHAVAGHPSATEAPGCLQWQLEQTKANQRELTALRSA